MEETFAGLVAEVEKAVRPLGFRIEEAVRREQTALIIGNQATDDGELRIAIVCKGKTG